jgi:hypothetical protein
MSRSTPALSLVAALVGIALSSPAVAGTWKVTRTLDGPTATSSPPDAPVLAMNAGGHALTAWNTFGVVRYADLSAAGAWTVTRNAPGSAAGANAFTAALGRSDASVIVYATVATRYVPSKLVASVRSAGGAFGPVTEVAPGAPAAWEIRAGVACDGGITVAWRDAAVVRAARRAGTGESAAGACDGQPGAGPWSAPATLSSGTESVALVDLAVNDAGLALVTWQAGSSGNPSRIVATLGGAGGAWEAPRTVSAGTGLATWSPKPGLDAAGDAAIGYLDGYAMFVARRPAGGDWGVPEPLSGTHTVYYPALAMAADGAMLAGWMQNDTNSAGSVWQASSPTASGAWSAPRRVSTLAEDASWPSLSISGATGPAMVGWVDDATNTARVSVAAGGAAGAWKATSIGTGWWGGLVPVGAAASQSAAAWTTPSAGNPNAVLVQGRPWR